MSELQNKYKFIIVKWVKFNMPEIIEKIIEAAALSACKQINYSLSEEAMTVEA